MLAQKKKRKRLITLSRRGVKPIPAVFPVELPLMETAYDVVKITVYLSLSRTNGLCWESGRGGVG